MDMNDSAKKAFQESSDFSNYFCTYGYLYHQKDMLTDQLRMQCYHDAIFENKAMFQDKVVLDVGTGSGILAIWAAQAGARAVYAIEATNMAVQARKVVEANGLSDVVTVIQSKVEDIDALPDNITQVDIIISEWMGYFLLRESMFDSVLYARNKWLNPTSGAMYPSHATMYLCPMKETPQDIQRQENYQEALVNWSLFVSDMKAQWQVDMSCLNASFHKEQDQYSLETSSWVDVSPDVLMADPVAIKSWDLRTCTLAEIKADVVSPFAFQVSHVGNGVDADNANRGRLGGFCGWFDVDFHGSNASPVTTSITLSTSPFVQSTHWGQQAFPIFPSIATEIDDVVQGMICVTRRTDNQRLMNVKLTYSVGSLNEEDNDATPVKTKIFQIE